MIYRIYYEGKRKFALPVKNREELMALRDSEENLQHLKAAKQGSQEEKGKLLQLAYNIGHVEGALAGCKSIGSYFFHDVDCYDKEHSKATKELILAKKDEIGLRMLERSASGGWHLVCQRVPGTSILENQVRVATILQLEMDTSAKDLQRVVYSTSGSEEDLVYLDDCLFSEPMSPEECEREYNQLKGRVMRRQEQVPPGAKKANKHYRPWEEEMADVRGKRSEVRENSETDNSLQHNIPLTSTPSPLTSEIDERVRFIAEGVMKEKQLENSDFLNEGGRHTTVKIFLSGVTQLLKKEEVNAVLQELMPQHWQDENIQQLVSDFYQNYTNPSQRLLKYQEQLFTQSQRLNVRKDDDDTLSEIEPSLGDTELSRVFASKVPPEIPEELPRLLKVLTQSTPKMYKGAVVQAVFPSLATYPKQLSFRYTDNLPRELRINCLLIAGSGTGKNKSTDTPIAHIIADMKERDEMNRERLKKFNEEYNAKAGNKQKPQRPADLVIQTIKSDITKAALVQRMDEAQGAPLFVKLNELEQWDKIEGYSGRNNQFTTLKLCDDENNDFGTDRAGTQSVTGSGSLHLNWNANTTPSKVLRYFKHVVTDGPISRLCLATIPEREIGADMPVFGDYGAEYDEALKPFIENLKHATGYIDCVQARKMTKKLKAECAEFAQLSQDKVFDELTSRALPAVFRKACLLYAANGMKWEKAIEPFCRWSLYYDLWLKMKYWGDQIRHADDDIQVSKRGPQNLLLFLPNEFTLEDAKRVRQQKGLDSEGTRHMISNWQCRGFVSQISDLSFKKEHPQTTRLIR